MMSMDATARWALPFLFAGQAQKEIFHNEALARVDMLLHARAESADMAVPPPAPEPGQCWIIADGATGAWNGKDGQLAGWTDGGWRFVPPTAGMRIDVADRGHALSHDGAAWRAASVRDDGVYIEDKRVIGRRAGPILDPDGGDIIDVESRAALGAILSALRAHGLVGE